MQIAEHASRGVRRLEHRDKLQAPAAAGTPLAMTLAANYYGWLKIRQLARESSGQ
jgi:hypothetical protein